MNVSLPSGQLETLVNQWKYSIDGLEKVKAMLPETGDVVEAQPVEVAPIVEKKTSYNTVSASSSFDLPKSVSREAFRNLTGTAFMASLNATMVKAPADATEGELTVTLDKEGESYSKYPMYTWNVIIGYKSCKIMGILDRDAFPITQTVKLEDLDCKGGSYNAIEDLKAGKKIAVFVAMDNGIAYNGHIEFR